MQTLPDATARGTCRPVHGGAARRHGPRAAPRRARRHREEPASGRGYRGRPPPHRHAGGSGGGPRRPTRAPTTPPANHPPPRNHDGPGASARSARPTGRPRAATRPRHAPARRNGGRERRRRRPRHATAARCRRREPGRKRRPDARRAGRTRTTPTPASHRCDAGLARRVERTTARRGRGGRPRARDKQPGGTARAHGRGHDERRSPRAALLAPRGGPTTSAPPATTHRPAPAPPRGPSTRGSAQRPDRSGRTRDLAAVPPAQRGPRAHAGRRPRRGAPPRGRARESQRATWDTATAGRAAWEQRRRHLPRVPAGRRRAPRRRRRRNGAGHTTGTRPRRTMATRQRADERLRRRRTGTQPANGRPRGAPVRLHGAPEGQDWMAPHAPPPGRPPALPPAFAGAHGARRQRRRPPGGHRRGAPRQRHTRRRPNRRRGRRLKPQRLRAG